MPGILTNAALALTVVTAAATVPPLTHVEGAVTVDGNRVRTAGGRAELLLADGALLHLDRATVVGFDGPGTFRLADGRVMLRTSAGRSSEVQVPYARLVLAPAGIYTVLVDAVRERLLVSVAVGGATLETRYGSTTRIAGRQMAMMTSATSVPWAAPFEPARFDAFESWSDHRAATAAWASGAPPDAARPSGVIVDRYPPASQTCSSWISPENPCWLLWAPRPHAAPGRHPYTPVAPNYAPGYAPNYAPNFTVTPPSPPAARPSPPMPPPAAPPPAAPPTTTAPPPAPRAPARGEPNHRVPGRPGPR